MLLGAGSPLELRKVACDQQTNNNKNLKIKNNLFLFLFSPWSVTPQKSAGLSHGSPPFDFEVAFCLPPTS
jgi:hypothetical protein